MWVPLTRGVLAAVVSTGVMCFAVAAPATSNDVPTIGLRQAVALTVERNPVLQTFGSRRDAHAGDILQAGLRPNPELFIEVEDFGGNDTLTGVDSAEATVSLAWMFERGKRQGRLDAARAGLSVVEADAEVARLDAAANTARIYLDCLELQLLRRQAESAVDVSTRTRDVIRDRVGAGRTATVDLELAETDVAERSLVVEDFAHLLSTCIRRLAAQWGDTDPGFREVRGDAATLPELLPYERLRERLEGNPELTRYLSVRRLREAEVRLAQSRAKPDWRFSAGLRHLERPGDQAFVANVTIPLAFRNRNQGAIRRARADLEITGIEREAERVRVETRLFEAYEELAHSLHVASAYREEILPGIERALQEAERAYEAGLYSYLELESILDRSLRARSAATVAAIEANRNLIEIERLTGTRVTAIAVEQGDTP